MLVVFHLSTWNPQFMIGICVEWILGFYLIILYFMLLWWCPQLRRWSYKYLCIDIDLIRVLWVDYCILFYKLICQHLKLFAFFFNWFHYALITTRSCIFFCHVITLWDVIRNIMVNWCMCIESFLQLNLLNPEITWASIWLTNIETLLLILRIYSLQVCCLRLKCLDQLLIILIWRKPFHFILLYIFLNGSGLSFKVHNLLIFFLLLFCEW